MIELYRAGASTRIESSSLESYLGDGWSMIDPNAPLPFGVEIINPDAKIPYIQPTPKKEGGLLARMPPAMDVIGTQPEQPKKRGRPKRLKG